MIVVMDDAQKLLREKQLVSCCEVGNVSETRALFDGLTLHDTQTDLLRKIMVERDYYRYEEALLHIGVVR
jgi:hypothetical protein